LNLEFCHTCEIYLVNFARERQQNFFGDALIECSIEPF
jgi:hypothetical protein